MRYVNLVIGSKEWLEFRKTRIGASDSAAILGISPFATPYQLWEQKILGVSQTINSSMKRGIDREEEGRRYAEEKLGVLFEPKMVLHHEFDWKFCTLDGIDMLGNHLLEVKWANKEVHSLASKGVVIDYYFAQCQSQMSCTGVDKMWFLSCYQKDLYPEFILVEVKRDNLFIEKMIEKEKEFYQCIVNKTPPALIEKDYVKLEDSLWIDQLCSEYQMIIEEEKMIKSKKEEIIEQIKKVQKNSKTNLFKITKSFRKGVIDYEKIPELQGVNLENYRKESIEVWKISKI